MPSIGAPELLIVLAIVVVLFGATRIGDIGKGLGRGIKEFRKEIKDEDDTKKKEVVVTTTTTEEKPTTTSKTH